MSLNEIMSFIKDKVNFKEHKYRLPLILFPLIIIAGYFIIKLLNVSTYNIISPKLKSTEFLNPELPEAKLSGKEVQTRREALENTYGHISEISPFDSIDEEILETKQDFESINKSQKDIDLIGDEKTFDTKQNQKQSNASLLNNKDDSLLSSITQEELTKRSLKNKNEALEELQKAINEAQLKSKKALLSTSDIEQFNEDSDSSLLKIKSEGLLSKEKRNNLKERVAQASSKEEVQKVKKSTNKSSSYFNTIKDEDEEPFFIRAIIDEDIKAQEQSRVRLRLLDAIEIDGKILKKGTYLYATMSGFSSQRVKGVVESVFIDDLLTKVNLSIYDMDGIEGLYVPESSFREVAKDVLSGTVNSNVNISSSSTNNSFSSWAEKVAQNAYNNITNMMSKNIKKNKALLKYGTFVYLVNKSNTNK